MSRFTKIVLIDGEQYKDCIVCKEIKPLNEFHKRSYIPHGVRGACKECRKKEKRWPENKEHKAKYFQENFDRMQETHRNYWNELKSKVHARLGKVCVKCGFSDHRALQIDHINGNGNEERKTMTNAKFLRYLLIIPEDELLSNYQLLCANCNMIKKIENKEFRKKRKSA